MASPSPKVSSRKNFLECLHTLQSPSSLSTPHHFPHKITPRPRSFGRPIPREVSYHSLICPHPLTPQAADKSDDSFQLVYSVQIRERSDQPRGARLPLQRRLCGTAECRLHELGWREAAVTSFGQLQASRPQKGPPMSQSVSPRLQTEVSPVHMGQLEKLLPGF